MNHYLEQILQIDIQFKPVPMLESWPYLFGRKYALYKASCEDYSFYVIRVQIGLPLRQIVSDFDQITNSFFEPCCVFFDKVPPTPYMRQSLIHHKIPYWIQDRDVYLPFLGVILARQKHKAYIQKTTKRKLSFTAQRFLFQVIYHKIKQCTASSASKQLGLSMMTYSRIFDELKGFDGTLIDDNTGRRRFVYPKSPKSLWKRIQPYLQSPVVRTYALAGWRKKNCCLAGISALSQYSMLDEDNIPTYAISIQEERLSGLPKQYTIVPDNEIPGQKILVLRYSILYHDSAKMMDPLSLAVALYSMPIEDPRIKTAIDEMLEQYVFS